MIIIMTFNALMNYGNMAPYSTVALHTFSMQLHQSHRISIIITHVMDIQCNWKSKMGKCRYDNNYDGNVHYYYYSQHNSLIPNSGTTNWLHYHIDCTTTLIIIT